MLLMNCNGDSTSLRSYDGHVDVAKVLLQNGADVNAVEQIRHFTGSYMLTLRKFDQNGAL